MSMLKEIKEGLSCSPGRQPDSVVGRTACVAAHPGKMAIFPLVHWFEKRYRGKYRFAHLMFSIDLLLIGLAVGLAAAGAVLWLWKPAPITNKVYYEVTVAPREVVSGASSTVIIRYTNGTGKALRDVTMSMGFPEHFLLQELAGEEGQLVHPTDQIVEIGELAPGSTGAIRVRGVMFGDVGGKQTFRSIMTFTYGDEEPITDQKVSFHTFSPVRSTLALDLHLPEKLVAGQVVEGTIAYRNTGEIDFPEITLEPVWPEGFVLMESDAALEGGSFVMPAIAAGEEGVVQFKGRLGDHDGDVTFFINPSFTFGDTRYRQDILTQTSPIVPLPLRVSHSVDADALRPGSTAIFTITYTNEGAVELTNAEIGIQSDSPFFPKASYSVTAAQDPALASIAPGASGTVSVSVPLRSSISQSQTSVYEHLTIATRAFATFDMEEGLRPTSRGEEISTVVTTPIVVDSFARYTATTGDQLGRGPLPPLVGEPTKYWIFWNIRGTTNPITQLSIEGQLGRNVVFTGKQTVSEGAGVTYDPATNTISWHANNVSPTLSPSAKVIGIAFEVSLTPDDSQLGTAPTLISGVRATGTDATTGAFISASAASATTNLPGDAMAAGLGTVEF